MSYYNEAGYADPTACLAIRNAERRSFGYRPLVYICSAYSGDELKNAEKAKRYSRFAVDEKTIPIAPHLLFPLYMKEDEERDLAMFMDLVILGRCEQLWVFGEEITPGMEAEIRKAKQRNMMIRHFTEDLKEIDDGTDSLHRRLHG